MVPGGTDERFRSGIGVDTTRQFEGFSLYGAFALKESLLTIGRKTWLLRREVTQGRDDEQRL